MYQPHFLTGSSVLDNMGKTVSEQFHDPCSIYDVVPLSPYILCSSYVCG